MDWVGCIVRICGIVLGCAGIILGIVGIFGGLRNYDNDIDFLVLGLFTTEWFSGMCIVQHARCNSSMKSLIFSVLIPENASTYAYSFCYSQGCYR